VTLTEASRGVNGIHWDPKVAPPCYLCETELKTEAAATVVDMMEAAEDEFPSKTAKMSALLSARHSLIEYDADAAQATEDDGTLTDCGGRNGRSFGRGAYHRWWQGRGRP
jgi:hypothetical protein